MTFARFMELALYHPELGYYRNAAAATRSRRRLPDRPRGPPDLRPGDRPPRDRRLVGARPAGRVHDPGARRGTGALAAALLDGVRAEAPDSRPSSATGPSRSSRVASRRCRARLGRGVRARRRRPDHRPRDRERGPRRPADPPGRRDGRRPGRGLRRARGRPAGRRRGEPSTPELAARLDADGVRLADGQQAEVCLATDRWVAEAAAGLGGRSAAAHRLRSPGGRALRPAPAAGGNAGRLPRPPGPSRPVPGDRPPGPDRARRRHAVERAAAAAGLDHVATTTQGPFLAGLGAGDLLVDLQTGPDAELQSTSRPALGARPDDRPGGDGRLRGDVFGRPASAAGPRSARWHRPNEGRSIRTSRPEPSTRSGSLLPAVASDRLPSRRTRRGRSGGKAGRGEEAHRTPPTRAKSLSTRARETRTLPSPMGPAPQSCLSYTAGGRIVNWHARSARSVPRPRPPRRQMGTRPAGVGGSPTPAAGGRTSSANGAAPCSDRPPLLE